MPNEFPFKNTSDNTSFRKDILTYEKFRCSSGEHLFINDQSDNFDGKIIN